MIRNILASVTIMMLWNRDDDDDDDDIIEWCETKRRLLPPFDSSPVLMNFTHHRPNPKFGSKIIFGRVRYLQCPVKILPIFSKMKANMCIGMCESRLMKNLRGLFVRHHFEISTLALFIFQESRQASYFKCCWL